MRRRSSFSKVARYRPAIYLTLPCQVVTKGLTYLNKLLLKAADCLGMYDLLLQTGMKWNVRVRNELLFGVEHLSTATSGQRLRGSLI